MKMKTFILFLLPCILGNPVNSENSLIVSSTKPPEPADKENKQETTTNKIPEIYQMRVISNVANRFAHTTVLSKVRNAGKKSQEAVFSLILPEKAFISGFVMEIGGKNYTAYVQEKEEAKKTYDAAVSSGQGAAHVAVSARDSNRFTVSVNIEPQSKAIFYLSYEELLQRQEGHYDLLINLHPGQPVKDLSVEVTISESRKITDLRAPPLRSGNEISSEKSELDPRADIRVVDDKNAVVTFTPNIERQKQLAGLLGTNAEEGLSGQFVVQYDVERDPSGGEVLILDGYFIHFFAPSNLKPLPKHVVFILDTSSSMYGQKIVQLREAMVKIVEELNEHDKFNLVEFNSNVKVWDLEKNENSVWYPSSNDDYSWTSTPNVDNFDFSNVTFPAAYQANADNIKKAKEAVATLSPNAATDIYSALRVGFYLVELAKIKGGSHQPMIIFLTDGDPTVRLTSTETIITKVTENNSGKQRAVLYTLAFGDDADKNFLKKVAVRNSGFSRHIYEAADASLQLQNFYKQISSPLLSNVTFKYEQTTTSLTTTEFPMHFGGSELVVAGFCGTPDLIPPMIEGWDDVGPVNLKPTITRSVTSTERLWAYLTVKQILDKKETASDKEQEELKKKALELSLKYEFVTPVSSLVVVKPNSTDHVEPKPATKVEDTSFGDSGNRISGFGSGYPSGGQLSIKADTLQLISAPSTFDADEDVEMEKAYFQPEATTQQFDIFVILSWLSDILKDGFLILKQGNFKLGLNETFADHVTCPKSLVNATGRCALLGDCKEHIFLLTGKDVLEQHFCVLRNEYAGVCCPHDP